MVTRIAGAGLVLAAALAHAPSVAQNVTADPDRIASILQKEGYQAKRVSADKEPRIETAMAGYNTSIYFFGCDDNGRACKTVQFYAGFNPKQSPTLQAMNDYARENRFGRIYLDKEGDPIIEMDVDLEVGGMSEALFIDNLAYWESILGRFGSFVFKNN